MGVPKVRDTFMGLSAQVRKTTRHSSCQKHCCRRGRIKTHVASLGLSNFELVATTSSNHPGHFLTLA